MFYLIFNEILKLSSVLKRIGITKAPAVGVVSSLSSESYDSNIGLYAFCWDRSDPAACSNISRNLKREMEVI